MSDQGSVYAGFIATELQREFDRRDKINAQAMSLATSAGGLLTLSIALVAFLRGKSFAPEGLARALLGLALAIYVIAVALALWATMSRKYRAVTASALDHMLTDHWTDSEITARNIVGILSTASIGTLREGNEAKARLLIAAGGAQILALTTLGVAVSVAIRQ